MSLDNGKSIPITNISAYKFINLDDLPELQLRLHNLTERCHLQGTILLSLEGINLNLAGHSQDIASFCQGLQSDSRFNDLVYKHSESDFVPFKRMMVKIKPEIITFKDANVQPAHKTVRHLPPKKLLEWLDAGVDLLLVDTRNEFEIEYGTFANAKQVHIHHFSDFTQAAKTQFSESDKKKPVVLFCTGGVRCEKAGPAFEELGFEDVYQLEGGILAYFEQCGSQHYTGDCFVFDERIALNPSLQATRTSNEHQ